VAEQPTIVVRGEVQREVPPDQAEIGVTIRARDRDRESVLARLTERAAEVRAVVDDFSVERRETGHMRIYPELKRGGERVVAYTGSMFTTVVVTDFDRLGDLLMRLARLDLATVAGPWWQLRPGSPAEAEVRKEAVREALRRAAEYAEAVGARVDRLIEIADEATAPAFGMPGFAVAGGARSTEASIEVDPELQTVRASVIVRVAITEPTLPG
jgi:uncharacterized protein YggE